MIKYVPHKNIDLVKYDQCIQSAINTRIYAFSWYLDCVTDEWDVLVLNDYEAVMPLPVRTKYGFNYVYQAPWIQQLGVFSKNSIDENRMQSFMDKIPKKFVLVDYMFNAENVISSRHLVKRTNFLLKLNKPLNEITASFNKNRKRIVKRDFTGYNLDKKGNSFEFLEFYKNLDKNYKSHKGSFTKLQHLLDSNLKAVHIWNVYKNGKLLAGLVWLKDDYRITYLVPVATEEAKKENLPTFIINELIKEYQNTDTILDFEGSMIDGVANFYRSFGAEEEEYSWYRKRLF